MNHFAREDAEDSMKRNPQWLSSSKVAEHLSASHAWASWPDQPTPYLFVRLTATSPMLPDSWVRTCFVLSFHPGWLSEESSWLCCRDHIWETSPHDWCLFSKLTTKGHSLRTLGDQLSGFSGISCWYCWGFQGSHWIYGLDPHHLTEEAFYRL